MTRSRSGRHLIADGVAPSEVLRDKATLELLLLEVAKVAEMQVIDLDLYDVPEDPTALGEEKFRDPGGITGYAVLTTSHASIHTFPPSGEFRFDLYSCKDFEVGAVLRTLCGVLRAKDIVTTDRAR